MDHTKTTDDQHVRLLIAHDGTDGADAATQYAAHLFPGAVATIAYVSKSVIDWGLAPRLKMPDQEMYDAWVLEAANARLDAAVQLARTAGLDATGVLRTTARNAARTILEIAQEHAPDVIVAGKHAPGRLGGFRLGSVSQALASQSETPVLIVPTAPATDTTANEGPIVVGFDASDGAFAALELTARLFPGSSVIIASTWEPIPAWVLSPPPAGQSWSESLDDHVRAQAEHHASIGVEHARALGLTAELAVLTGNHGVAGELAALAVDRSARALCVGTRTRSRFQATSLGSTTHASIADATLPVLVAHTTDSNTPEGYATVDA